MTTEDEIIIADLNIIPCGLFTLELVGDTCTRKCNHLKRLVCGTDGVTYENPCMFKCAQQVKPSEYSTTCS